MTKEEKLALKEQKRIEKDRKRAIKEAEGKGFFREFKKFISKGNVVDLAVGVIIGGAFTAIVTALTTNILTPFINWIISLCGGKDALKSARTILGKAVYLESGEIDWTNTIYIDWGAFISAIINFLLIALVLFLIVKAINTATKKAEELEAKAKEDFYKKHPEARPVPKEVEPSDHELLKAMLVEMKKANEAKK